LCFWNIQDRRFEDLKVQKFWKSIMIGHFSNSVLIRFYNSNSPPLWNSNAGFIVKDIPSLQVTISTNSQCCLSFNPCSEWHRIFDARDEGVPFYTNFLFFFAPIFFSKNLFLNFKIWCKKQNFWCKKSKNFDVKKLV